MSLLLSQTILVSGLTKCATKDDVCKICDDFEKIQTILVRTDDDGNCCGQAYVTYHDVKSAKLALDELYRVPYNAIQMSDENLHEYKRLRVDDELEL